MTILVAYVPRPEGQAALDKGIEIAKSRNEHLVVVNATLAVLAGFKPFRYTQVP